MACARAFARARRDVVVLRFDGVRNIGESYKDPDCREPGREALRSSLTQAVDDIHAVLDHVYNNPLFSPSEVVLCCFSLQGVPGRRAAGGRVGRRRAWTCGRGGAGVWRRSCRCRSPCRRRGVRA